MTTLELCGPGCDMVVFVSDGKPSCAVRRDRITFIEPYNVNPSETTIVFERIHGLKSTYVVDMPFDAVLGLLNFGTPYHTEPANASQRGD